MPLLGLARPEFSEENGPVLSAKGRSDLLAFLRHLLGFDERPHSHARDQFEYLAMRFPRRRRVTEWRADDTPSPMMSVAVHR